MYTALKDLLVVSLEQAVAGPYCSSRLADAGARVIKVERDKGDFARDYDRVVNGESAYFVWLNRGKESMVMDIKQENDRELLLAIIDKADVFIQNLSPGAAKRAGLGSDSLRARNERLISVDISGYGEDGSYRDMKAYDLLVQCESGLASITGTEQGPARVGVSVCDIACGMYAYTAVLQALLEREQTGCGTGIKVSLFDSIADWMTVPLLQQQYGGRSPQRCGLNHPTIAPYGIYRCGDRKQLVVSIQNDTEWRAFCQSVLQQSDLAEHPLFSDNVARCNNREKLDDEINRVFAMYSRDEILSRLRKGRIAYGLFNSVEEFSRHGHLRRCAVDTPSGIAELVSPPAICGEETLSLRPVPALGEHSKAIRAEFLDSP